jgi:peptidoglycan hydrolase-like protein with peptidoglycan-binding domain
MMDLAINRLRFGRLLSLVLLSGIASACESSNKTPIGLGGIFNQPTTYAAALPNDPTPNPDAGRPIGGAVDKAVLLPGGDYTLTTLRERPVDGNVPRVLCQAPSPDWATAIAMQQQLSASGNFFQGSSGQFSGSNSYTETIAALAGRTAGVVALRDGLYSACQAYANGVIGKDAYALILSQYGYLLVALAGNNSSSSNTGNLAGNSQKTSSSTTSSTQPGVAVAVNTAAAAPAPQQQQQGKGSDTSSAPNTAQLAQMQIQIMHALMVACISAQDPTARAPNRIRDDPNELLSSKNCRGLMEWMKDSSQSLLVSLGGSSKGGSGSGRTYTAKAELPDVRVLQVQNALRKQSCTGCQVLPPDGVEGTETSNAVRAYQKEHNLAPNGNVRDPATLAMLGLKEKS